MISQFKSRRALKKLRKKRLQKKNANIRRQLNKHRNSPKRRIMDNNVNYIGGSTIVPPNSRDKLKEESGPMLGQPFLGAK